MKKFYFGAMIALAATAFLSSCEKNGTESEPVALSTPVLTVVEQTESSFMVIWDLVENAVSYTYTINNGTEESTTNESAQFTDLTEGTYTVKVKAVAPEGDEFIDSDWASISVTLEGKEDEPLDITGTWVLGGNEYSIESDGANGYLVYTPFITGDGSAWTASLSDNVLTIDIVGPTINVEFNNGEVKDVPVYMCAYHSNNGTGMYLWPEENSVWEFTSNDSFVLTNGMFIGYQDNENPNSWWSWEGSSVDPDTEATRSTGGTSSASAPVLSSTLTIAR